MNLMTAGEILDKAFEVLRKNIKTIILYGIGFAIVSFIIVFLLLMVLGFLGAGMAFGQGDSFPFFMGVLIILFFITFILFYFAFGVGIFRISAQDILNYRIYAAQLISSSLKSIFKLIKILVAIMFISIPAMIACGVVSYVVVPYIESVYNLMDSISGGQEVFLVIFFILLWLAIILAIGAYITCFCFTLQVAFIEDKGALESINRSFKLVKSNFKSTYGYFILINLITMAINISLQGVIGLLLGIIFLVLKLISIEIDYASFMYMVYGYSRIPINVINWIIVSPISYIMLTILYFNQRYKLEGYDISLKLKELRNNVEKEQVQ